MTGKGLSGAQVIVVDNEAIKLDYDRPTRVISQGQWLVDNSADNLPFVKKILPRGYVMEALNPIPTVDVELYKVVTALADSVWRYAPTNLVDTAQTLLKVSRILELHAPHLLESAINQLAYIRKTDDCLTHGDPTAENVMLRGEKYVVIDPLPSTEAVPDDLAVDVGKLLQSAHGWEDIKGDQRASWSLEAVAAHFTPEVFEVGELWCIVHFMRTLPYVTKEVQPRVVGIIEELLGF